MLEERADRNTIGLPTRTRYATSSAQAPARRSLAPYEASSDGLVPAYAPGGRLPRRLSPYAGFYYRYVFRYLSQRSVLNPEAFYDRYVNDDFETQFVPHAFEGVCRQYLVRQNRGGRIEPPFDLIGTYSYDDPTTRTNGEFDVVTRDPLGYAFYEAKFRSSPVTQRMIEEEIEQVQRTGLMWHRYGFFSRAGFDARPDERTAFIGQEELYR